jgi:selenocysteine lyase/cysteine desulfurase
MPKMTPAQLRELFPATRSACYLNAAAASPISLPVEKAISGFYREAVESGDVHFPEWLRQREAAREALARFIGAQPHDVAFTPSTSYGVHVLGRLLLARGIGEVVTLEGEFPSTTLPLLNLGLTLRVVKARADGSYALEDLEAAVGPRTGALIASAVQYASGFRLDLEGVSRICKARNLRFAVNAAQALGQIPLRVDRVGADFLCATSHKWLFGGYGVGIFYARREMLEGVELPMGSWLSVENPMAMDNLVGAEVTGRESQRPFFEAKGTRFRREATALEIGAGPIGLILGLGAGLALHEQVGLEETERHNGGLQTLLRSGLRRRGFVPNAPDDPAIGSGICVIPVEGDPSSVVRELGKSGVVLTPRGGGVRISTHVYNVEEDVEKLLWAIDEVGVKPKR